MKARDERQLGLFGVEPPAPVAPVEEAAPRVPDLRLEENLAILAGAGAGKTWSLVTICLHLLGGARRGEPVPASMLGLLTFTEKAADEMRGRLRARLEGLAQGADEPELRASFTAVRKPFPLPAFWKTVRDELGAATIGTFHSLCTQLLRRAPPKSGVDANFTLLEEREARWLMRDLVERAVLERVDAGTRLRTMVAELGFGRLVDALVPIATRLREEGVAPDYVHVADGPTLRAQFEQALKVLQSRSRVVQPGTPVQQVKLREFVSAVAAATFETFERDLEALREATHNGRGPLKELREETDALSQLYAAVLLAPFEAEVRELLAEIAAAHDEALSSRGALDFTGLLVQARNLLRDHPEARLDARRRFGALLVDEFQDTNRLQLELVLLLAEEGAPRPISTAFEEQHDEILALPQRRGFLAVVGDRKQSIYEFRGADVSVFEVMARAIERNGGGRLFLKRSRRSTPALVEVFNRGFTQLLRAPSPAFDFDVAYVPEEDDLIAVRTDDVAQPLLQLVDPRAADPSLDAQQRRALDAEAVARALQYGLAGPWAVRGGQIAVLFQRFTQLELYRQALVRHGIRHRVVRGRGFHGAQEVLDLASLLSLLADPDDAVALSAVLRSPLVALTDAQWLSLARPADGSPRWSLDSRAVLFGDAPVPDAVETFRRRFRALHAERDRLGLRTLLRLILEVFDYRLFVAAGPFGEQALANLDKLLVLAGTRDRRGTSLSAFARELVELADEAPTEAQAEVVDELDPDAVTLCTVHQAKGLEWPVVVLPDLATPPRNETSAVRFDRTLGLGIVRPRGVTELRSLSAESITQQLARRARAEHLRLLYVALTRAKDRVVLGLLPPRPQERTWARDVAAFFPLQVQGARDDQLDVSTLPEPLPPAPGAPVDASGLEHVIARVRAPWSSTSRTLVLPVTQLVDHALCARRFHFAHQIGLLEQGGALDERLAGEPLEVDARLRGTAAHRLLELVPLDALHDAALSKTLRTLRRSEGLERTAGEDVLAWVERFLRTDFARGLSRFTVHRELPFALRVEGRPALVMRGQIDLVVETPEAILVIDYKTTLAPPSGLEPFRVQLGSYALAAQQRFGAQRPLRAGLCFLREPDPSPRFFDALDLTEVRATLLRQSALLDRSQHEQQWPGLPRKTCEAIGCGYVYRCHSS